MTTMDIKDPGGIRNLLAILAGVLSLVAYIDLRALPVAVLLLAVALLI